MGNFGKSNLQLLTIRCVTGDLENKYDPWDALFGFCPWTRMGRTANVADVVTAFITAFAQDSQAGDKAHHVVGIVGHPHGAILASSRFRRSE